MGGRAEAEDVEDHDLVVAAPPAAAKAPLRGPLGGQAGLIIAHPFKVDAVVDRVRQGADFDLFGVAAAEIFAAVEDAAQQQCGVHVRQLGIAVAHGGVHVEKVVIPALVADKSGGLAPLGLVPESPQRRQDALPDLVRRQPAVIAADAECREAKADGSDAAGAVGSGAVLDQAVAGVGLLPEKVDRRLLHHIEKSRIIGRNDRRLGRTRGGEGERQHEHGDPGGWADLVHRISLLEHEMRAEAAGEAAVPSFC